MRFRFPLLFVLAGGIACASPAPAGRFAESLLGEHNRIRAEVGVAPLTWSTTLATYAQEWADRLGAEDCVLTHRLDCPYGENLAGWTGNRPAGDAARIWEEERTLFDGGPMNDKNFAAGHYTQVVWRDSQRVGCGQAVCGDSTVIVCNYEPAGNVFGEEVY